MVGASPPTLGRPRESCRGSTVRRRLGSNPTLVHEHALIRTNGNWGPPMTFTANLGRDRIISLLHSHGARDFESAAGRAALQVRPAPCA